MGNHIKARRLERKLFQDELAEILEVSTDTITNWETGRRIPKINYYPSIIKFLGYIPKNFDLSSFPNKLKYYRLVNGLSQREMGKLLNRDASTVSSWENGESKPYPDTLKQLEELVSTII